ncbi:MAG: tRNA preQ1(34) S-adenosylmethionine ribosyltransferase-isomerase QueA [Candidatus Omnitrophica bacterium]|nr:tRNA preQ1(34) S-adenosylmethionine ribosyltransferase-isomerase QueA [Candidatus Omnitrophota bacterium]
MTGDIFNLSQYDFKIPQDLIAQEPANPRDSCRLLVLDRKDSSLNTRIFRDIVDYLREGDVLILNNTKVIRAKLKANRSSGAKLEILLLEEKKKGVWEALVKPGKRARVGETINFSGGDYKAKIIDKTASGSRILDFRPLDVGDFIKKIGKVPLPHYIKKGVKDPDDYQTIYAKREGAVAAPTAGLHFTPELIKKIEEKGVKILYVTLHCSLATFRPVKCEDIRDHLIESERVEVTSLVAKTINQAKKNQQRIIAVGTTAIRSLESAVSSKRGFWAKAFSGPTNLYITPGYKFKVVDALITNFHTPSSTNLVLVSAFAKPSLIRQSYTYAKDEKFRFYSFGDAMLIV